MCPGVLTWLCLHFVWRSLADSLQSQESQASCWFSSSSWCSHPPPTVYGRLYQTTIHNHHHHSLWVFVMCCCHGCIKDVEVDAVWRMLHVAVFYPKTAICKRENLSGLFAVWASFIEINHWSHTGAWHPILLIQPWFLCLRICVSASVCVSLCHVCLPFVFLSEFILCVCVREKCKMETMRRHANRGLLQSKSPLSVPLTALSLLGS